MLETEESIASIARPDAAARSTARRWREWGSETYVRWRRIGPSYRVGAWAADWVGPQGGHYTFIGLTRRAVRRRIRRELARWDKKLWS
jgi:hypothetical protein